MEITDEQLVKKYITSIDDSAFEELIKRYLPMVFNYVKRYTGNNDVASDITQETFVKAWKNIKKFDTSKNFKAWIFTIAKNTAINELKKKNAIPFSDNKFEHYLADNSLLVFDKLVSRQTSKDLMLAVEKLPDSYKSVINMRIKDDLKLREIADKLDESLNTVKSRYRRGLALLRDLL